MKVGSAIAILQHISKMNEIEMGFRLQRSLKCETWLAVAYSNNDLEIKFHGHCHPRAAGPVNWKQGARNEKWGPFFK